MREGSGEIRGILRGGKGRRRTYSEEAMER